MLAPRLKHSGASAFVRQLVRWCATRLSVSVVEEAGLLGTEEIDLSLVDAETAKRPLRTRVAVALRCDDDRAREAVLELLEARGFRAVVRTLEEARANERFVCRPVTQQRRRDDLVAAPRQPPMPEVVDVGAAEDRGGAGRASLPRVGGEVG